jgi:hypothetical protein
VRTAKNTAAETSSLDAPQRHAQGDTGIVSSVQFLRVKTASGAGDLLQLATALPSKRAHPACVTATLWLRERVKERQTRSLANRVDGRKSVLHKGAERGVKQCRPAGLRHMQRR